MTRRAGVPFFCLLETAAAVAEELIPLAEHFACAELAEAGGHARVLLNVDGEVEKGLVAGGDLSKWHRNDKRPGLAMEPTAKPLRAEKGSGDNDARTVSQVRHRVSDVRTPSKRRWTKVGSWWEEPEWEDAGRPEDRVATEVVTVGGEWTRGGRGRGHSRSSREAG